MVVAMVLAAFGGDQAAVGDADPEGGEVDAAA
jgi:hypothetical protein